MAVIHLTQVLVVYELEGIKTVHEKALSDKKRAEMESP